MTTTDMIYFVATGLLVSVWPVWLRLTAGTALMIALYWLDRMPVFP